MPLPEPVAREKIHQRDVICVGYRREDGLWDLDGHLTDVKTYPFKNRLRGEIAVGEPIHEMWMRITIDDQFVIRDIIVRSDKFPLADCPDIVENYQALIGLRMGPGFNQQAKKHVGRIKGCSHLSKLIRNLCVVALQTVGPLVYKDFGEQSETIPPHLDRCHALRIDGDEVREHYPRWYKKSD